MKPLNIDEVKFTVLRNGQSMTEQVTFGAFPESTSEATPRSPNQIPNIPWPWGGRGQQGSGNGN